MQRVSYRSRVEFKATTPLCDSKLWNEEFIFLLNTITVEYFGMCQILVESSVCTYVATDTPRPCRALGTTAETISHALSNLLPGENPSRGKSTDQGHEVHPGIVYLRFYFNTKYIGMRWTSSHPRIVRPLHTRSRRLSTIASDNTPMHAYTCDMRGSKRWSLEWFASPHSRHRITCVALAFSELLPRRFWIHCFTYNWMFTATVSHDLHTGESLQIRWSVCWRTRMRALLFHEGMRMGQNFTNRAEAKCIPARIIKSGSYFIY